MNTQIEFTINKTVSNVCRSETLPVEDFENNVYVAGVEADFVSDYDKIYFTDNIIHNNGDESFWPIISNYPWRTGISTYEGTVISSTEMVWKWRQYNPSQSEKNQGHYDWGINMSPTIFTRYYDGSG